MRHILLLHKQTATCSQAVWLVNIYSHTDDYAYSHALLVAMPTLVLTRVLVSHLRCFVPCCFSSVHIHYVTVLVVQNNKVSWYHINRKVQICVDNITSVFSPQSRETFSVGNLGLPALTFCVLFSHPLKTMKSQYIRSSHCVDLH